MSDFWKAPSGDLILNLEHVVGVDLDDGGEPRIKAVGGSVFALDGEDGKAFLAAVAERAGERYQLAQIPVEPETRLPIVSVAVLTAEAAPVIGSLRDLLARLGFGVTLQGVHLTVRWRGHQHMQQVTMIVDEVDDGRGDDLSEGG